MADELARTINSKFDRWDLFWSEYMVWSMRLVCYSANEYFFFSIRAALVSRLPSWGISIALLIYGVVTLWAIENAFARNYNPAYRHLQLTKAQKIYRVGRERLLYSCLLYSCANLGLGFFLSMMFSSQNRYVQSVIFSSFGFGLMGIVGSIFGVFVGIVSFTGRFGEVEKRVQYLYPIGLAGFLVPTLFVLYTIRHFFFSGSGTW